MDYATLSHVEAKLTDLITKLEARVKELENQHERLEARIHDLETLPDAEFPERHR